jgi:hypothetical protein
MRCTAAFPDAEPLARHAPSFDTLLSSQSGTLSLIWSLPLSVKNSCLLCGWKSKPTVLRTPAEGRGGQRPDGTACLA